MKYNLLELATELERQKASKRDVVVSTSLLQASAAVDNNDVMVLSVPSGKDMISGQLEHDIERVSYLTLTPWAHTQMAAKCDIPKKYYDRILGEGYADLLAKNVNAWLPSKEQRMVRILDGQVRAILSDRYRAMDNEDLLMLALEKFKDHNAQIHRCDLSTTKMYVKAVIPELEFDMNAGIPNTTPDIIHPGLLLANSEVGSGRFKVEPFFWRTACSNGLLLGVEGLGRVHLGGKLEIGDVYSDETKRKSDDALWSQVNDIIGAAFNPEHIQTWASKIRETKDIEVPNVQTAIDNIVSMNKLPEADKKNLLEHFMEEPDKSAYGLVNAVTRYAHHQEDYEKQIELETLGGKLVEMPAAEWQKKVLETVEV